MFVVNLSFVAALNICGVDSRDQWTGWMPRWVYTTWAGHVPEVGLLKCCHGLQYYFLKPPRILSICIVCRWVTLAVLQVARFLNLVYSELITTLLCILDLTGLTWSTYRFGSARFGVHPGLARLLSRWRRGGHPEVKNPGIVERPRRLHYLVCTSTGLGSKLGIQNTREHGHGEPRTMSTEADPSQPRLQPVSTVGSEKSGAT